MNELCRLCESPAERKGLCIKHYMREYRASKADGNGVTDATTANPVPSTVPDTNAIATAISAAITAALSGHKADDSETREYMDMLTQEIDTLRAEVTALRETQPRRIEIEVNGAVNEVNGLQHEVFQKVLRYVANGINVMLVGPAGSGKTTLARQVAEALGRPFYFSGAILQKYELTGFMDATGNYVSSNLRKAYEQGGIFLWDELDSSAPDAVVAFNALLENGHADFPDGVITRAPGFGAIAACNTYGKGADRVYVGRTQLDGSTLDRFAVIDMDYDEVLERALIGNDLRAMKWTDKVIEWRKAAQDLKIRHIISPRASIKGAIMILSGESDTDTAQALVWKGLEVSQIEKIKSHSGVN